METHKPDCPTLLHGQFCYLMEDIGHWDAYDHRIYFWAFQTAAAPPPPQPPVQKQLCPQYDTCTNTFDEAHVEQFYHKCRYRENCRHRLLPKHNARFLHNGDANWYLVMEASRNRGVVPPPLAPTPPPTPFGLRTLTSAEVSQLRNAIKAWYLSHTPVTHNGQTYQCRGLKCASARAESQEVVLFDASTNTAITVNKTAFAQPPTQLNFAWHGLTGVKHYQSDDFTRRMNAVLARQLSGTNYTASAVLQYLLNTETVFLVGGVIRDVLFKVENTVKDIDMAFSHSSSHIAALVANQYPVSASTMFGRIQFGTGAGIFLEGKTFNGVNNDRDASAQTQSKCMAVNLEADLICRDFACNTLWYDLVNHVLIDPTGQGLQDLHDRKLRIPVSRDKWDTWAQGNPTKLLRYIKLVLNNYAPIDPATEQFIAGQLRAGLVNRTDWTNFCSYNPGLNLRARIMQLLGCNGQAANGCRCPACIHN